jgi:hypothetical protein
MNRFVAMLRTLVSRTLTIFRTCDAHRKQRGLSLRSVLLQDLRYGFRQLWRAASFAIVAVGSLALGIGASVAVFSDIRAVLLDPYPYKDADRMIHVELRDKTTPHGSASRRQQHRIQRPSTTTRGRRCFSDG